MSPDPVFIVSVRDVEWFTTTMAKAMYRKRVLAIFRIDERERHAIRPDKKLTAAEMDAIWDR